MAYYSSLGCCSWIVKSIKSIRPLGMLLKRHSIRVGFHRLRACELWRTLFTRVLTKILVYVPNIQYDKINCFFK